MDTQAPIDRAIRAVGTQQRLAEILGIKSASISEWKARCAVPANRCIAIETATGVSRHDLRPDVFGPAPANESQPVAGGEVARAA